VAHSIGAVVPSAIMAGDTPVAKVMVGDTQVWPTAAEPPVDEPPYLYDAVVEYLPAYAVKFTLKKGIPVSPDEAFAVLCSYYPAANGYVTREFTKTFRSSTSEYPVEIQDLYGDGTANADSRRTLKVFIWPKP
jgi:hypothetical protein